MFSFTYVAIIIILLNVLMLDSVVAVKVPNAWIEYTQILVKNVRQRYVPLYYYIFEVLISAW